MVHKAKDNAVYACLQAAGVFKCKTRHQQDCGFVAVSDQVQLNSQHVLSNLSRYVPLATVGFGSRFSSSMWGCCILKVKQLPPAGLSLRNNRQLLLIKVSGYPFYLSAVKLKNHRLEHLFTANNQATLPINKQLLYFLNVSSVIFHKGRVYIESLYL